MTLTLSQQIVRQACIKANPSIMELSFGCRIKNGKYGEALILRVEKQEGESDCYYHVYDRLENPMVALSPRHHNWEILGHEPTLADVLLAMPTNSVLKINNLGGFSWFIDNEWKDIATPRWNLSLPFSQQSEEVLIFLASLLK